MELPSNRARRFSWVLLPWLLCLLPRGAASAGEDLDPGLRPTLEVFLKALPYDKRFTVRCQDDLRVAVVARAGAADSQAQAAAWQGAMLAELPRRFPGVKATVERIDLQSVSELDQAAQSLGLDLLLLCRGLDAELEGLVDLAARRQLLLLAAVPAYVERGAALGVDASRSPATILSNPASAQRQGSEFAHSFLKLTRQVGASSYPAAAVQPAPPAPAGPVLQTEAQALKRRVSGRAPEYPERALRRGKEATLLAEIVIDAQGQVKNLRFVQGDPLFEPKVLSAIKTWRFAPHLLDGRAVETAAVIKFDFRLESKQPGWLGR